MKWHKQHIVPRRHVKMIAKLWHLTRNTVVFNVLICQLATLHHTAPLAADKSRSVAVCS